MIGVSFEFPIDISIQLHYTKYVKKKNMSTRSVGWSVVIKVKWTLVQALRLCTGRTARRGSRGIGLLFS